MSQINDVNIDYISKLIIPIELREKYKLDYKDLMTYLPPTPDEYKNGPKIAFHYLGYYVKYNKETKRKNLEDYQFGDFVDGNIFDNEEDFAFAETIIQYLKKPSNSVKKYYSINK